MSNNFENTKQDWESHDEWRFADRDAERRYFFEAGQSVSAARIAELECQKTALQQVVAELEAELLNITRSGYTDAACRDYCHELKDHAELEADCKAMAEGLIKSHKVANCGNNKAMDYIRHGAIIKACPACVIAAKYREGE